MLAADTEQLDETYSLRRKFEAANGLDGDLHDFRFTEQGTALMTVYDVRDHDLSSLGKATGPIWDCLVQEVDIATGHLVFEWRASEHLDVSDTHRAIGGEGEPGGAAFDWFHLNSVDKDPRGNYMVSSRYLHSLTYIHGGTGRVLWVLGGKRNMFADLSGGNATNFAFQHDARWDNDYKEITLFDNSDVGRLSEKSNPRGMRIKVDQKAMTATLLAEYRNPHRIASESQGSVQTLPGGNVVVGFGFAGAFTEFSRAGTPLCDTHYGPEANFGSGDVQSYRVLKFAWRGYPATDPDLAVARDDALLWRAYASWNGATEVTQWVLQGTDDEAPREGSAWSVVERRLRDGFETDFVLEAGHPRYLRVVGLDYKGNALGTSLPVDAAEADVVSFLSVSTSYTLDGCLVSDPLTRCRSTRSKSRRRRRASTLTRRGRGPWAPGLASASPCWPLLPVQRGGRGRRAVRRASRGTIDGCPRTRGRPWRSGLRRRSV